MRGDGRRSPSGIIAAFLALSVVWSFWLEYRHWRGDDVGLNGVEHVSLDLRFRWRGPRPPRDDVVIVALDEATIQAEGAYPIGRGAIARIVRTLAAAKPALVALDIAFVDPGNARDTEDLANALRSTTSVVAAFGRVESDASTSTVRDSGLNAPRLAAVVRPVAAIADAAPYGLANIDVDSGGVPRFAPMIYDTPDGPDRSFALAAAALARKSSPSIGAETITLAGDAVATDFGAYVPLNFYGPAGHFRQISAARLLTGDMPAEEISGKIVVIGATASGAADVFASPFDPVLPGVEVWATAIDNLLNGDALILSRATRAFDGAAMLVLPFSAVVILEGAPAFAGALGVALAFLVWASAVFVGFSQNYWLSVSLPLAAYVPVVSIYGVTRIVTERAALRRVAAQRARLSVLQAPGLLGHILEDPGFLSAPMHLRLTVLFVDLSGSTGMAEALGPERTQELLSGFQTLVDQVISAHAGVLISYMGDGALAIFGFPKPAEADAARVLAALQALRAALATWLGDLPAAARSRLDFRMGAHFGPTMLSRIGPADHQQITVTGDTVNVANRLLDVAKEQKCRLIVTEDLVEAAAKTAGFHDTEGKAAPFTIQLRGRTEPIRVRIW